MQCKLPRYKSFNWRENFYVSKLVWKLFTMNKNPLISSCIPFCFKEFYWRCNDPRCSFKNSSSLKFVVIDWRVQFKAKYLLQKPFSNCSILKTTFYVRLQVQQNEYNEDVELSRPHVQFYMHKKARNGSW